MSQTTVTPAVNHSGASYVIKLDGVTDADGVIALSVGSNVITVEVTAEDGNSTETYTVTVTREVRAGGGGGGGGGGGPVNQAPVFVDAEGDAITEIMRVIAEDAAVGTKLGEPVAATDPEEDTLTYTLGGEDAASFAIDASTGQLTTAAALDHETQANYAVTVTATDPSGATAEVRVTITVTVTEVEYDCSTGNAVEDAADNPGLVADCEALLASRGSAGGRRHAELVGRYSLSRSGMA